MQRAVITIEKSFYYTAGKIYRWCGVAGEHSYDMRGVGINVETLQNYVEIEIIIDGKSYMLDCRKAINFIRRYGSVEDHKGVSIGIVSKSLLIDLQPATITTPKPEEVKPTYAQENLQPRLL